MSQVSMTVRMDSELKKEFSSLCSEFGMSANVAINIFAKAVVQRRCIPFEIRSNDKVDYMTKGLNEFYEMRNIAAENQSIDYSLNEINDEIKQYRTEKLLFLKFLTLQITVSISPPFKKNTYRKQTTL